MTSISREQLATKVEELRAAGQRVVFTNGCFDILHAGHVTLLRQARDLGDFLIVGLNSDASTRRLKGPTRPVHDEEARATVLSALAAVDAVVIFEEDTPVETLAAIKPSIHVKGGDYDADTLPETPVVRAHGGEIVIIPLVEGYSTTRAVDQLSASDEEGESGFKPGSGALVMIPARYGSTRFPGKPLVDLEGQSVIERVVRAALETNTARPVMVATDDERIAAEVEGKFSSRDAVPVMTSEACHTGTDRLAEATRGLLGDEPGRVIVINVQGDEPFLEPGHLDALVARMEAEPDLQMATLATPLLDEAMHADPNVVKVVLDESKHALYFSRAAIPFNREGGPVERLRHLGIYAYDARWLLKMASLPPGRLEEIEKLEQLRALEHGVSIGVEIVHDVVPIAIDTPEDLERAGLYLRATVHFPLP